MTFAYSKPAARRWPDLYRYRCLEDVGYQSLSRFHAASQTPIKRSKHHSLRPEQKAANRQLARQRIRVEHLLRKLKVFHLLSERYRNRRQRFGLRFNLIAAVYNFELRLPPLDFCKRSNMTFMYLLGT